MNHKTTPKINLQIALDIGGTDSLLRIARAVSPYADWIETGTPWIMQEGISTVHRLREILPEHVIVADLKIMDAGQHEAAIGFSAGADIVTVLGAASNATISGAIQAAHSFGKSIMVDLIQVANPFARLQEVLQMGAHFVGLHNAFDDLQSGLHPEEDISRFTGLAPGKVIIGGGIDAGNIAAIARCQPCTIIVGRAVTGAPDPARAAADLRRILDSYLNLA